MENDQNPQNRLDQNPKDQIETLTQSQPKKPTAWIITVSILVIIILGLICFGFYWMNNNTKNNSDHSSNKSLQDDGPNTPSNIPAVKNPVPTQNNQGDGVVKTEKTSIHQYKFDLSGSNVNIENLPEINCESAYSFGRDTYKCMSQDTILQPCYPIISKHEGDIVKCPSNLTDQDSANIYQTTLPDKSDTHLASNYPLPWSITLEDGTACYGVGGATGTINDKRANYGCVGNDLWLFGGPEENSTGIYNIGCTKLIKSNHLDNCQIKEIWF